MSGGRCETGLVICWLMLKWIDNGYMDMGVHYTVLLLFPIFSIVVKNWSELKLKTMCQKLKWYTNSKAVAHW